jgi:hypothetical protein
MDGTDDWLKHAYTWQTLYPNSSPTPRKLAKVNLLHVYYSLKISQGQRWLRYFYLWISFFTQDHGPVNFHNLTTSLMLLNKHFYILVYVFWISSTGEFVLFFFLHQWQNNLPYCKWKLVFPSFFLWTNLGFLFGYCSIGLLITIIVLGTFLVLFI